MSRSIPKKNEAGSRPFSFLDFQGLSKERANVLPAMRDYAWIHCSGAPCCNKVIKKMLQIGNAILFCNPLESISNRVKNFGCGAEPKG